MAGMIVLFKGRRGAGKTLSLVATGLFFKKYGWKIYSNFTLTYTQKIDNNFLYSLSRDSNIKNCVLLLDELQVLFDSRLWGSGKSIKFSHFIQQIRKRNIVIMGTTQFLDTLEKRIRQHVDVIIQPVFDDERQVCNLIFYDVTSLEEQATPDNFELSYHTPQIYPLYDTNELI